MHLLERIGNVQSLRRHAFLIAAVLGLGTLAFADTVVV